MEIERGSIVVVNFNPTKGTEQKGIRPAIVVQSDRANKNSPHTIVIPLTSKIRKTILPSHTLIKKSEGLIQDSIALAEQIRTIDKSRIVDIVGKLSDSTMRKVNEAIKIILDIDGGDKANGKN